MADRLSEYKRKRDLAQTPEPGPRRRRPSRGDPIFVIQQHDATAMHYDFRLEVDGVLKSWAVPKGPSTNPATKRMARPTEDHPMEYATFEGVIPKGNYGAGPVIVWDRGTYRNLSSKSMEDGLRRGHISFELDGDKLQGGWALTRFRTGKDETWLLVKKDDEHANRRGEITSARPESVSSGRTIDQLT